MKYTILATILCFFATVKVIADILAWEKLSAVATITNVAPAMKVFTAQKGYETYSSTFELAIVYTDGFIDSKILTPRIYAGLQGPYNRRNIYGALIAYGPVLFASPKTQGMWKTMAYNAFCRKQSVLSELNFADDRTIKSATIKYHKQVATKDIYPNQLHVTCER